MTLFPIRIRPTLFLTASLVLLAGCRQADSPPEPDPVEYAGANALQQADAPYVLLVSIDGYRHDYNALYGPPNLTRFASQGVAATSLIPPFPSDTFPSHYTIATGMFPGTHGIVANTFFDPARNAIYRMSEDETVTDGTWYGGTPLWAAAEQAGMVAATFFWPGSEAEIRQTRPSYYETYDGSVPHAQRIAQVLEWLDYPEAYRPHFVSLYFSAVDSAAHDWGPESDRVRDAVIGLDRDLGTLFEGLERVTPSVDVFIVSDHGMVAVAPERVIDIDAQADLGGLRAVNSGSKIFLYSDDEDRLTAAYEELKRNESHYRVFRQGETPDAWHADNPRFGQIIVAAEAGYALIRANTEQEFPAGAHGYDPYLYPEVRGIFYARGPHLASSRTIPATSSVHVYPLIMELLGLESPEGVDGSLEVLGSILD